MAQALLLATDDNPVIQGTGTTTIDAPQHATWITNNGSTCTITITNPSVADSLTIVISGAPTEITATDGSSFDGQHVIPPNSPTTTVTAFGDFKGQQVSIVNVSSPSAPCYIDAFCPG